MFEVVNGNLKISESVGKHYNIARVIGLFVFVNVGCRHSAEEAISVCINFRV